MLTLGRNVEKNISGNKIHPYQFNCFWIPYLNEIVQYSYVSGSFHSAKCPPDSSMSLQMAGFPSFLRLNNIPLCMFVCVCVCVCVCVYTHIHAYHIFFFHSSVEEHLDGFQVLVIMNNAAMNMRMQIFFQFNVFV